MIYEEINKINESDFLPGPHDPDSGPEALIAGGLMATSLFLLGHEIVVKQNPNSSYNEIKRAFQDPSLSMEISNMDIYEIEEKLKGYPRSGKLSKDLPRRTTSVSPREHNRIAMEISKMDSEEIYNILQDDVNFRAAFKDLMSPEDQLRPQKDNTLYRESKRRRKTRKS